MTGRTDLDFTQPFTERTPRIINAAKLHRAAARRKTSQFIVEGENAVDAAVATGAATDLFVSETAAQRFPEIISAAGFMGVYTHAISDKAVSYLADTTTPAGIFALCRSVLWSAGKILSSRPQLLSIPVQTQDPGNAGTLIRTADALGADGVIFAGETVDPLGSKVARSSAGSLFHIPVARQVNTADLIGQLRAAGLQIIATSPAADLALGSPDLDLAAPTAWLFGNEAHGLSPELLAAADIQVTIPLRGRAESLNLATAASICLYESARAQAAAASAAAQ